MRKSLTLKEWIIKTGEAETAQLLRVTRAAVRHWRRGYCLPRAEQMQLIKKYSHGQVSYDEMIDTYHKQKLTAKVKS